MSKISSDILTDTDFKIEPGASLFWGAISRWFGLGVSVFLGLLVTPVIIRTLGKDLYGLWGVVASFSGFYGLFDFGLSSAAARFLGNAIGAKDIKQFNRVISTGNTLLRAASFLVVIFAAALIVPAQSLLHIPDNYTTQFRLLVILSAVSMAISMMMAIYGGALLASEDFIVLSGIRIFAAICRSVGGLVAVLAGKGVVGLVAVNVFMTVLEQSITYLRFRKRFPQVESSFSKFDIATARNLIGFGTVVNIVFIAELVRSKSDVMLVTRFGGLGQAGLYAVAIAVFGYFFTALVAVFSVTTPRLNKLHGTGIRAEFDAFFHRASHLTSACASLLAGLLIGLAPLLIRLWIGRGFEESSIVLQILVGGYFLDFATQPGVASIYATGRQRYFAFQSVIEATASFTCAYILGDKFGMKGVAAGIVIPIILIRSTAQPWFVARNLSISFSDYWFRTVGAAISAMLALAGGLALISDVWRGWLALSITVLAIGLAAIILWLLVLNGDDRTYSIAIMRRVLSRLHCLDEKTRYYLLFWRENGTQKSGKIVEGHTSNNGEIF
jgi:O-antigen/teichoic acid export membrane protein